MPKSFIFFVLVGRSPLAGYVYDYSYPPTLGPVHAVSFTFTSTNLITAGPLSFAPFNVIEGAHTQTVSQGSAGLLNLGGPDIRCFVFGTANAVLGPGAC